MIFISRILDIAIFVLITVVFVFQIILLFLEVKK